MQIKKYCTIVLEIVPNIVTVIYEKVSYFGGENILGTGGTMRIFTKGEGTTIIAGNNSTVEIIDNRWLYSYCDLCTFL